MNSLMFNFGELARRILVIENGISSIKYKTIGLACCDCIHSKIEFTGLICDCKECSNYSRLNDKE